VWVSLTGFAARVPLGCYTGGKVLLPRNLSAMVTARENWRKNLNNNQLKKGLIITSSWGPFIRKIYGQGY